MNQKLLTILFLIMPASLALGQSSHERLSAEQRQVAVQLERLKILIKDIGEEEKKKGNEELASTLIEVYEAIENPKDSNSISLAIEAVAQQLAQKKSSRALEQQALIIKQLQELLDMLVERENKQKEQQEESLLKERKEKIESFLQRQEEIRRKIESNDMTPLEKSALSERQKAISKELKEFNQQQQQKGIFSDSAEEAQKAQQEASEQLEQDEQSESRKSQSKAIEDLERAKEETERQQEINNNQREENILRNIEMEIQEILNKHKGDDLLLKETLNATTEPLKRLDRINLNKIANNQDEIASRSDDLLLDISQAGADSFPFFILQLMEDHSSLSDQLKQFSKEDRIPILKLSENLISSWGDLLDVIITERERKRKKIDNPNQESSEESEQENQEALVQFAAEMQLLKRMQKSLGDRVKNLIGSNNISSNELRLLTNRQNDLQLQYESMIRRLQGSEEKKSREEL